MYLHDLIFTNNERILENERLHMNITEMKPNFPSFGFDEMASNECKTTQQIDRKEHDVLFCEIVIITAIHTRRGDF